tara:strand:- start:282 stop:458 length:177 start_codon:yes stop_codon:yes gene_type:complete
MKTFKVTKSYITQFSGEFQAENAKDAEELFDCTSEDSLEENYIGLATSEECIDETVEI